MSSHAYAKVWVHLVWGTLRHERLLQREAAVAMSDFLMRYSRTKAIEMKVNFVNPEHVHALVAMPTELSLADLVQLLKGSSSHWANESRLVNGKFAWGRGYGAFSVSQSSLDSVAKYIAKQEEHHRVKTFGDEFRLFAERYGLKWRDDETVETVSGGTPRITPG